MLSCSKSKCWAFGLSALLLLSGSVVYLSKKLDRIASIPMHNALQTHSKREQLISALKVYDTFNEQGPLKLTRHGSPFDGGYVTPTSAFEKADVLLGYGIADDNTFETSFSKLYNKPSFGFDCGIDKSDSDVSLYTFKSECISTDAHLYKQGNSNGNMSTFSQQLEALSLKDKQLFIKMDIEGAEYEAFKDIFKHSKNITGIVLEVHVNHKAKTIDEAVNLLKKLEEHFYLVHVHGNNCVKQRFMTKNSIGEIPNVIELSYINKKLITKAQLKSDQSHPTPLDKPNCEKDEESQFTVLINE